MKKVAIVFVMAVLVPSLTLAWLAVRSLRDQQYRIERQQSLLYQGVADALSKEINDYLTELQRNFGLEVELLLLKQPARELAATFDDQLPKRWPLAEVGFAVSLDGQVFSPPPDGRAEARRFRLQNDLFLSNRGNVEGYWNIPKGALNVAQVDQQQTVAPQPGVPRTQQPLPAQDSTPQSLLASKSVKQSRSVVPQQSQADFAPGDNLSRLTPSEGEFRQLVADSTFGTLARFEQNKLNLMFWYRSPRDPQIVFGALLDLPGLSRDLGDLLRLEPESLKEEISVALLDDSARPVRVSRAGFQANWRRPFVATEIGEVLPHWEVGVYLLDPAKLGQTAHTLKLTLGLLIAALVLAIGTGGWLIVHDLQRQLRLTRQKTDFVSNVSHELKTPLTSIRMFAELLAEGRVREPAKQRHYLGIITAETARLTRLINNVLDFSRLERGEKQYQFQACDLGAVVRETADMLRPHLEAGGFQFDCRLSETPIPVRADRDAIAQVLVNLLSNAEKYSAELREITVEVRRQAEPVPHAEVRILDRGLGVPPGCAEKVFEQFYRAHDALNSGIQGSGLGLTLARQIARAHGGTVAYEPREGGGSCFLLRLPVSLSPSDTRDMSPPL